MLQRLLALLLILVGLIGLVLGRLGETTWAPPTEVTATAELSDPGAAVVIDPGVLYVGGMEGTVEITGSSDVSVITAPNSDIDAYLEGTRYTRITGASDWSTLSTEEVNADGAAEISDPLSSDLWRSVTTTASPQSIDIAEFAAGEHGENEQVYRELLVVTDGTNPGADSVSITWPVEDSHEWVPYAYAGGATIAVIGLVLFVLSFRSRRRAEDELEESSETAAAGSSTAADAAGAEGDPGAWDAAAPAAVGAAGAAGAAAGVVAAQVSDEAATEVIDTAEGDEPATAEEPDADAGADAGAETDADAGADADADTEIRPAADVEDTVVLPAATAEEQPAPDAADAAEQPQDERDDAPTAVSAVDQYRATATGAIPLHPSASAPVPSEDDTEVLSPVREADPREDDAQAENTEETDR